MQPSPSNGELKVISEGGGTNAFVARGDSCQNQDPTIGRWLILRIERCPATFPVDRVIVDRDNNRAVEDNAEDEGRAPAWAKVDKIEGDLEMQPPEVIQAKEEHQCGLDSINDRPG
jgi:hypothetical protein